MIVAVDTQLAVGTATGAGVYARDLVAALRAAGTAVRELRLDALDPWRFDRRVVWDQVLLPIAAARSGAQILHAAGGTLPLVRTLPTVVTVHDVAWLRAQGHTRAYARAYFGSLQSRAYRGAAAIVCDSTFSANEYRALVDPSATPHVVYPGVDLRFAALQRAPRTDPPVALVVGTVEARKNLGVLVESLRAIPSLRIVSVGPHTPYKDEVLAHAAALGVADRLELRGYIPQTQLDELYRTAALALVPSRYEGFGYALAEAMCAGLPAIAARSSSLVEVAAADVPLVDPDDSEAWIRAIAALLADPGAAHAAAVARRTAAVERFAWQTAAARMLLIYGNVLARGRQ